MFCEIWVTLLSVISAYLVDSEKEIVITDISVAHRSKTQLLITCESIIIIYYFFVYLRFQLQGYDGGFTHYSPGKQLSTRIE